MSADKTNKNVTLWTIILGVLAVIPVLGALYFWSYYMIREILAKQLQAALGQLGLAGGCILALSGLVVVGLVLIDRLRIRHDASTSGEASPAAGLVLVFLGVALAAASVISAPQLASQPHADSGPKQAASGSASAATAPSSLNPPAAH